MKRNVFLSLLLTVRIFQGFSSLSLASDDRFQADDLWTNLKMWYDKPIPEWDSKGGWENSWMKAIPFGNGHLGARNTGGVKTEHLTLNDNTFWTGGPKNDLNPKVKDIIPQIRQAVFADDLQKANDLTRQINGSDTASYLPLGDLHIDFDHDANFTGYYRELDLNRAVVTVRYKVGSTTYTREEFASYPDNVIVVHLTSSDFGQLSFTVRLDSQVESVVVTDGNDSITASGVNVIAGSKGEPPRNNPNDMTFQARVNVLAPGAIITAKDNGIHVVGGTEATLIVAAATSFNGWDKNPGKEGKAPVEEVTQTMNAASRLPYEQLLKRHLADYQPLFRRFALVLDSGPRSTLPTDQRYEENGKKLDDPSLVSLITQYMRYALIQCSRAGGQVANEQANWDELVNAPWRCNLTTNENTEKYYWQIEPGNIPECGEPYFTFMEELAISGARTAQTNYGCRGWVEHHNTDLWRMTTPASGDPTYSSWPMGGVWLCHNLWEHYAFGQDKTFLRDRAYPIMKGAAEFCLDWLVDDGTGHLITCPSTTPEQEYMDPSIPGKSVAVSYATTMDMALINDLFTNCIAAAQVLNTDHDLIKQLTDSKAKLLPPCIRANGALSEWAKDYTPADEHHRHASLLAGLWPGHSITPQTPELFEAARKALDLRGDSGGNIYDKPAMWARLLNGDNALHALGSTDVHEPSLYQPWRFLCSFSGVYEMLVQSQNGTINLLPALPHSWSTGHVQGLRARGGFEIAMDWDHGVLKTVIIKSVTGTDCTVKYGDKSLNLKFPLGASVNLDNNLKIIR